MEDWIDARLAEAGRTRTGPVELVRERPWSTIHSAPTTGGTVWLKQSSPSTAFEVGLYALLADTVPDHVLTPLGIDVEGSRLLLPDGGVTAWDQGVDVAVALPAYADLQRALAPHVDALLALGVADMRPAIMPQRYAEALGLVGMDPPVEPERYTAWCEELAAAPGGASIDHNDLHGGNVFPTPDGAIRFYDWGDAVVAHPFASLLIAGPDGVDAYLGRFADLAPHAELVRTLELACRVAKVARALTWHRAASLSDNPDWRDAPRESLEALADDAPYITG